VVTRLPGYHDYRVIYQVKNPDYHELPYLPWIGGNRQLGNVLLSLKDAKRNGSFYEDHLPFSKSAYLFLLREGHLDAVFHVLAYLALYNNARIVFDHTYPSVDMGTFIKTDWK
jgi:hypothetical protein